MTHDVLQFTLSKNKLPDKGSDCNVLLYVLLLSYKSHKVFVAIHRNSFLQNSSKTSSVSINESFRGSKFLYFPWTWQSGQYGRCWILTWATIYQFRVDIETLLRCKLSSLQMLWYARSKFESLQIYGWYAVR